VRARELQGPGTLARALELQGPVARAHSDELMRLELSTENTHRTRVSKQTRYDCLRNSNPTSALDQILAAPPLRT